MNGVVDSVTTILCNDEELLALRFAERDAFAVGSENPRVRGTITQLADCFPIL